MSGNPRKPVVLVVEDEALMRMFAFDVIEEAGFTVLEAASAEQAIDILNARDDIRIIFTDVQMPGTLDGLKLASAVRDRWPPIEIIVTSGHVALDSESLPSRVQFLPKPYAPQQLVRALRSFPAA
jgi:CheY-like chemotaxis protein